MPTTVCNRFWYSSDQDVTVDEDGFLWLPRGELTQHINANVVNLAQLRNVACLALLGEPGSGKSTSLGVERDEVLAGGEAVVAVDLGSVRKRRRSFRTPTAPRPAVFSVGWSVG
jgi:hypothetical protein